MLDQISIATAGFSIIALTLLIFQKRTESKSSSVLAKLLLCILLSTQLIQASYIAEFFILTGPITFIYLLLLGFVGPLFYLYSQHVLDSHKKWSTLDLAHFIPSFIISSVYILFFQPIYIAYSLMFLFGGIYMGKLVWSLYQLRVRRPLFKMEFFLTTLFLSWAIIVVLVAILSAEKIDVVIEIQTIMLSLAIAAAIHIQLNYPHLLSSLEEIASREYQTTTLSNIDSEKVKTRLSELMLGKFVYQDSDLSLSSLAEMLSIKSHQLSELLNTQLDVSFSSYLRNQRIKAAEVLLQSEPDASVLAIGLSVGFKSQSAFYTAFKEINSIAPGQYRQQILTK